MDNYICIDGVKILLNDSQISELRATLEKIETEKNSPLSVKSMVMIITISPVMEKQILLPILLMTAI